jgi:hypothetical protein
MLHPSSGSKVDGVEIFLTPMEAAQLAAVISKDLNQLILPSIHLLTPDKRKVIIRVVKDSENLTKKKLHQKEKK